MGRAFLSPVAAVARCRRARAGRRRAARRGDRCGIGASHIAYAVAAARVAEALTRNVLLAPIESSVIPLPHQLQALSRALATNQVRLLLADEVGLGKTIEAGLILRELKLRGLVRRALVVVPKGLVKQWVAELRTHFDEEFRLLDPAGAAMYKKVLTKI